jgi:hypothetical protein
MSDQAALQQDQFYGCIGRLVVSWGHLEIWLDFSIAVIHNNLEGKTLQDEKPRFLDAKLKYLRKAARDLPALAPHRKELLKLADDIEAAAIMRHDLVHGAVAGHPNSPTEAEMLRLMRKKHQPPFKIFKVTTHQISKAMLDAQGIAKRVMEFFIAIFPEKIH